MTLPLSPPVKPQLAKSAKELPEGEGWLYEPKWDGFRTIVFREGDDVYLQSRNGKPMNRYFPEIEPQVRKLAEAVEQDKRAVYYPPIVRLLRVMHGISPRLSDRMLRTMRGGTAAPRTD